MYLLGLCIISAVFSSVTASGSTSTSALVKSLIANDDLHVRPDADFGPSTVITIGYTLNDIEKVKDRCGVYRLHGWLEMTWQNDRLAWNPSDHGNITILRIPAKKVWRPDIVDFSTLEHDRIYKEMFNQLVYITNTGSVTWVPPTTFTIRCNSTSDGKDPVDEISCKVPLGSWAYDAAQVDVKASKATIDDSGNQSGYRLSESSIIRDSKVYPCCPEAYSKLEIAFKAAYKPKN